MRSGAGDCGERGWGPARNEDCRHGAPRRRGAARGIVASGGGAPLAISEVMPNSWDDYARFYDWENARTMGRRDVRFWQRLARETRGPVLELGCGTGRLLAPMARAGARVV